MAKPLNALLQKDAKWEWSDVQFKVFENLKSLLCSKPILVFLTEDHVFLVEADSLGYATGAVLSQMCNDDKWHLVAYISKSLSPAEHNYDIYDKGMLAVMRVLEQWCHYLEGTKHPVPILTDHKNLEYFMTAQKLNHRQAQWLLHLSHFNINLTHQLSKLSAKPDLLSRRSDHKEGVENDNNNVILLKPELFTKNRAAAVFINPPLVKKIIDAQKDNEEWRETKNIEGPEWKTVKFARWDDGDHDTLLYKGKIYVPESCRHEVVTSCHDTPVAGHPGQWRTLELVQRSFWRPGMAAYMGKYVKSCNLCQRTKPFPESLKGN